MRSGFFKTFFVLFVSSGRFVHVKGYWCWFYSCLCLALGNRFANYLDAFKPYLVAGLRNHEEAQVCSAAIGVLADLCRAMETGLTPYLDEFMELLSQIVQVLYLFSQ